MGQVIFKKDTSVLCISHCDVPVLEIASRIHSETQQLDHCVGCDIIARGYVQHSSAGGSARSVNAVGSTQEPKLRATNHTHSHAHVCEHGIQLLSSTQTNTEASVPRKAEENHTRRMFLLGAVFGKKKEHHIDDQRLLVMWHLHPIHRNTAVAVGFDFVHGNDGHVFCRRHTSQRRLRGDFLRVRM